MNKSYKKYPRLYVESPLKEGGSVRLSKEQSHYLINVMRKSCGDIVRIFNGQDGEFLADLVEANKKSASLNLKQLITSQPSTEREVHLYFAPIKKQRMEWMIEKAVELGVTHLHPVLTQNTDIRKINSERIRTQIIEACEQCERLDLPVLHDSVDLAFLLSGDTCIYVALERTDASANLTDVIEQDSDVSFLIGPEGGFTEEEANKILASNAMKAISLGQTILRAETAALYVLSLVRT